MALLAAWGVVSGILVVSGAIMGAVFLIADYCETRHETRLMWRDWPPPDKLGERLRKLEANQTTRKK